MSKLSLSLSILLSVSTFSANADEVRFAQVGFFNGSDHALDVISAGEVYVVEPGESLSTPGMLVENLTVLASLGSSSNEMVFTRIRLEDSGSCPQPICLSAY